MKKRKYLKPMMKDTEYMEVTLLSDSPQPGGGEDPGQGGSIFG